MGVIFFASTGAGSTERTSRIIGPILRWFDPTIEDETIRLIQLVIRKCAHITEYAILAGLVWVGRRKLQGTFKFFDWGEANRIILPVVCGYAISDELHQMLVPGRQGHVLDVLLDTLGGFLGLLVIWWIGRWKKVW